MGLVILLFIIFCTFENFRNNFQEWIRSEGVENTCVDHLLRYLVVKEQRGGADIGVGCGIKRECCPYVEGNELVQE